MTSLTTRGVLAAAAIVVSVESISMTPFSKAAAQPLTQALELRPCHVDGLAEQIRCGIHEVFEDRERGNGRRLTIHVAVLPALRRNVHPDPLFLMAGGPGQGARTMAGMAARVFREVRRTRDIVLVDLRGTGASHALICPDAGDELDAIEDDDVTDMVRRCAAKLDADPRFYTHRESLADLDEIRARLGYARINLWGGSWGTRAALLYTLRYPERTRSVILDGAVALTLEFPRTASTDAQAALDRVIASCKADGDYHATFPDPDADLQRLRGRFGNGRIAIEMRHPRTGRPHTLTLSLGVVMDIIRGALYVPKDAATLMYLVRQAADGDLAPLVAQYVRTASWSTDEMAMAATMSVLCSEDVPAVMSADFTADAAGSLFGPAYAEMWRNRCRVWKAGPGFEESHNAISQAPALILSGGHDPVTPPRAGELMTRHFPNHRHLVVPDAAHNTSFSGCVPSLVAEFLNAGTGEALDDACVHAAAWPPFVAGTSGSRP